MFLFDRLLVAPTEGELSLAVREAVDALDRNLGEAPRLSGMLLDACTERSLRSLWNKLRASPEGHEEWRAQERYRPANSLVAVWWTDYLGRRHVRLAGAFGSHAAALPSPRPSRPPLACIYPEHCVIVSQHRRYRTMVVCGCGAWGAPEEVAWMGTCCGPCADREEAAPTLGWRVGNSPVAHLAVTPDGRVAACADCTGVLQLREFATGRISCERIEVAIGKLAFSPDGHLFFHGTFGLSPRGAVVFYYGEGRDLVFMNPRGGEIRSITMPGPSGLGDLAFSPDGRLLAGAAGPSGLYLWDVYTGRPRGRLQLGDCAGPVVFSPDGTALAVRTDEPRRRVALYDLARDRFRASLGAADVAAFAFSPDGEWVVTAEQDTLRVSEVGTGLERRALSLGDGRESVESVAFAPDGRFLLLGTNRGEVRVWPAEVLLPE